MSMFLISSVIGRKVWLDWGSFHIFPNLYLLLLGSSSTVKKSTSLDIARGILDVVDESLVYEDEFTTEAVLRKLMSRPQATFCWDEFGAMLSIFERSYMKGGKELFTRLYGCPPKYKRMIIGDKKATDNNSFIENPCINIATTSTLEWFVNRVKEEDIKSGFLARFLYVPGEDSGNDYFRPPRLDQALKAEVIFELKQIQSISGEADVTPEAYRIGEDWYFDLKSQMRKGDNGDKLNPFYSRLQTYLIKFALIYQISEDGTLLIHSQNMIRACQLINFLKSNIKSMVEDQMVFGADQIMIKKVADIIKSAGAIDHTALSNRARILKSSLEKILPSLIEQGRVMQNNTAIKSSTGRTYTKRTYTWIG
jgi:hypothetical protein